MDTLKRPAERAAEDERGAKKLKPASSPNLPSDTLRLRARSASNTSTDERNAQQSVILGPPPLRPPPSRTSLQFHKEPHKPIEKRPPEPASPSQAKTNAIVNGPDPRVEKPLASPHNPDHYNSTVTVPAENLLGNYTELIIQRQALEYDIRGLKEKFEAKENEYKSMERFGGAFSSVQSELLLGLNEAKANLAGALTNLASVKHRLSILVRQLGRLITVNNTACAPAPVSPYSPMAETKENFKVPTVPANGHKVGNNSSEARIRKLERDLQDTNNRFSRFVKDVKPLTDRLPSGSSQGEYDWVLSYATRKRIKELEIDSKGLWNWHDDIDAHLRDLKAKARPESYNAKQSHTQSEELKKLGMEMATQKKIINDLSVSVKDAKAGPEKTSGLNTEQVLKVQELIKEELQTQLTLAVNNALPNLLAQQFEPIFQEKSLILSKKVEKSVMEKLSDQIGARLQPVTNDIERTRYELRENFQRLVDNDKLLDSELKNFTKEIGAEYVRLSKRVDSADTDVQELSKSTDTTHKTFGKALKDIQDWTEPTAAEISKISVFSKNLDRALKKVERTLEKRLLANTTTSDHGQASRAQTTDRSAPSSTAASPVPRTSPAQIGQQASAQQASAQQSPQLPQPTNQLDSKLKELEETQTVQRHNIEEIKQRLNNISTEPLSKAIMAQITSRYPILDMNTARKELDVINSQLTGQGQHVSALTARLDSLWTGDIPSLISNVKVLYENVYGPQTGQPGPLGLGARVENLEKMTEELNHLQSSKPMEPTPPSVETVKAEIQIQVNPLKQAISEVQEAYQATRESLEPDLESCKSRLATLESDLTNLVSRVNNEIGVLQEHADEIICQVRDNVDEYREFQVIADTAISNLKVQLGFDPDIALPDTAYDVQGSALTLKEDIHRSRCATAQSLERLQKQVTMILTDNQSSIRSPFTRKGSGELDRRGLQSRSIKTVSPSLQSRFKESEHVKTPSPAREDSHLAQKSRNSEAKIVVDTHAWASPGPSLQSRISGPWSARWPAGSINQRDGQPLLRKASGSVEDCSTRSGEHSPVSSTTQSPELRIKGAAEQRTQLIPNEEGPSILRIVYSDDSDESLESI